MAQADTDLPAGFTARHPGPEDLDDLVRLLRRHEREARGWPGAQSESVAAAGDGIPWSATPTGRLGPG